MKVIQLRDYGRRTRVHAQQVHDQIAKALNASRRVRLDFADVESVGARFLDSSLWALVARHGAAVLRSIVFTHCSQGSGRASPRRQSRSFCLKSDGKDEGVRPQAVAAGRAEPLAARRAAAQATKAHQPRARSTTYDIV